MDVPGVEEALASMATILLADGVQLDVVTIDPKIDRVHVALRLDGAACVDCVVPPAMLRDIIDDSIRTRSPGEYELVIDDPRLLPDWVEAEH